MKELNNFRQYLNEDEYKSEPEVSGIYAVYRTGDKSVLAYVVADDKKDARAKVAMDMYGTTDHDIVKTGFFGAEHFSDDEYQGAKEEARIEFEKFSI
jgi:hypothetical protein